MNDPPGFISGNRPGMWRNPWTVAVLLVGLTFAAVAWQSYVALAVLVLDGALTGLVLLAATAFGLWLLWPLRLEHVPLRWQLLLGSGMGLGFLSLATLWLGLSGRLEFMHGAGLVGAMGGGGTFAAWRLWRRARPWSGGERAGGFHYLWLLVVPFAATAVLGASTPPGILWKEEGHGYDELDYHLALPKEYYQAGAIRFMPHNVYANFPANAEMLFLLTNVLKGDVWEAVYAAKLFNVAFAALTVASAWAIGRDFSPRAGVLAGVLAGTVGWMPYLASIAFVEPGMLFFGMLSAAAVMRCIRTPAGGQDRWSWALVAGLSAGWSCGFKYTAGVLVALPVGAGLVVAALRDRRRGWLLPVHLFMGWAVTFAPWLVKNFRMTGNPVFPLLYAQLGADPQAWDDELNERFVRGHSPKEYKKPFAVRTTLVGRSLFTEPDQRIGWLILLAGLAGLALSRGEPTRWPAAAMLAVQLVCWLFLTHLYARFIVPVVIPLVLLALPLAARPRHPAAWAVVGLFLAAGAATNAVYVARLYARHVYVEGHRLDTEGRTQLFARGLLPGQQHLGYINQHLGSGSKLLMVGDARAYYVGPKTDYCVVFNRSPFIEMVRDRIARPDGAQRIMAWLRFAGYTHVYVDYAEISRLRPTYGFAEEINPGLFADLQSAGLEVLESFALPDGEVPYGVLYRVGAGPGPAGEAPRRSGLPVPFDEPGVHDPFDELGVGENLPVEGNGRVDRLDDELVQAPPHAGDGLRASGLVHDELGDQRVIERTDHSAGVHVRVQPDARPAGGHEPLHHPGTGTEAVAGVLGVDAALDGRPLRLDVPLPETQRLAGGNP